MKSKIIVLDRTTGEKITINNTFKNLNQCIEHLEMIKKKEYIIIKKVEFKED